MHLGYGNLFAFYYAINLARQLYQYLYSLQNWDAPIEHRLFPHVTRAGQGVIFTNIELVKYLGEKTHTKTGLSVVANVLDKVYKIGRKVADNFKKTMQIAFDQYLPKWNYRAVPQT